MAHMFTAEASPEATEGNSQLKAATHSTAEPLALLSTSSPPLMLLSFGVEQTGTIKYVVVDGFRGML